MLPALSSNLEWNVIYSNFAVLFEVRSALPGDYNQDGMVDAADYVVWRKQVSANTTAQSERQLVASESDMTEDYGVWKANFGLTASARASSASSNSSANESAENSAVAAFAAAVPAGDQRQTSVSPRTVRTDGEQASRRVVDAAFDQIATNGRLPFEGPAAGSANRKARLVADRRLSVNMQHDDALTAYLLLHLGASPDQAKDEMIRFKQIDERFNEFATSGTAEDHFTGRSKDGIGDLSLASNL
jgi:hypothetical protein